MKGNVNSKGKDTKWKKTKRPYNRWKKDVQIMHGRTLCSRKKPYKSSFSPVEICKQIPGLTISTITDMPRNGTDNFFQSMTDKMIDEISCDLKKDGYSYEFCESFSKTLFKFRDLIEYDVNTKSYYCASKIAETIAPKHYAKRLMIDFIFLFEDWCNYGINSKRFLNDNKQHRLMFTLKKTLYLADDKDNNKKKNNKVK